MWLILLFYCQQVVALILSPPQPSLWDPTLDWPMVELNKAAATTVKSTSSSTSASSAPSISCDARIQSCPSCNGTTIQDDSGRPFQTLCQIEVRSSQSNTQTVASSAAACMDACQDNCLAATYIWEGLCLHATGSDLIFQDRTNGYRVTSYLRLGPLGLPIQPNVSTSASLSVTRPSLSFIPSGALAFSTAFWVPRPSISLSSLRTSALIAGSQLSSLYSSPISIPSPSLLPSSALPAAIPTGCSLLSLPCPDCDLENIVNARNQRYSVLCQSKLLSSDGFAYAEPLSLDACLAECDARGSDCIGVTFNSGACVIALGQMYGRFEDTNQVAFIPLINRTGSVVTASVSPPPQPTGLSHFPTGGFTFESIKNSLARATSSRPAPTSPAAHCGLDLVTCPSCNGVSLNSQAGNPYGVSCNVGLKCWKSISAWNVQTVGDCMAQCDQNHLCVGGYYQFLGLQSCFLCESGTYGTHALAGYTAFSRQHLPWKPMPWIPPTVSLKLPMSTSTAPVPLPSSARGFWVSLPSIPALSWPNIGIPRPHR